MSRPPLAITVDVEGVVEEKGLSSVVTLASFLDTLDLPVTLFVTPEVASTHSEIVDGWIKENHTVGLHIHPGRFGGDSDWLGTYEQSEIETFLRRGQTIIADRVGFEPTFFRAGRWSFSEQLLAALDAQGFEADASHRPGKRCDAYTYRGITEYPMTVVGNPLLELLLRPTGIEGIPLHADAFLRSQLGATTLYITTALTVASDSPYVMVSFHDYDLVDDDLRQRIAQYLARLVEWCHPLTLEAYSREKPDL